MSHPYSTFKSPHGVRFIWKASAESGCPVRRTQKFCGGSGNRAGRIHEPNEIENRLSPVLIRLAKELRNAAKEIDNESEKLDFTSVLRDG